MRLGGMNRGIITNLRVKLKFGIPPLSSSVVPKRRLGMRPAKRRFASLINSPNFRCALMGRFAKRRLARLRSQAELGNDRDGVDSPL